MALNRRSQKITRPIILIVDEQAFLAQFVSAELDGFHLIFASPTEARRVLGVRHVDLLVLDASIPADQKSGALACAGEANVPSVVLTRQPDFPEDQSAASMPVSGSDLAAILGRYRRRAIEAASAAGT